MKIVVDYALNECYNLFINRGTPRNTKERKMVKVTKTAWVKKEELESGAKLILAYTENGGLLLKKGRVCFYDTKWKTVY